MARSIRRPANIRQTCYPRLSNPKRIAEFRRSQGCDSRPPRCTGQMTPWNRAMMVLGRCWRQRCPESAARTRTDGHATCPTRTDGRAPPVSAAAQSTRTRSWRPTATRIGTRLTPSSSNGPAAGGRRLGRLTWLSNTLGGLSRHRESSPRQAWNRLRGTACSTPPPSRRKAASWGPQSTPRMLSVAAARTILPRQYRLSSHVVEHLFSNP